MSEYDVASSAVGRPGFPRPRPVPGPPPVLVVDAGEPRNAPAAHMHGFLSRDGLPPAQLLAAGRQEVTGYGGTIRDGHRRPISSRTAGTGSGCCWPTGTACSARRVLVTTGLRDELPDVPGLHDRWGRDVLHCPYCHGHEVRDRPLGVLGGSPEAVRYAQIVRQWSHDVVYFTEPGRLTAAERGELVARSIGVVEGTVERLVVDEDRLRGVRMADGRVGLARRAVRAAALRPDRRLLIRLGCVADDDGWVTVDGTGRTSVPGIWAAGNVVDPAPR